MVLVADWVGDHSVALGQMVARQLAVAANPHVRYGSWDCSDRCDPDHSGCCDCSGFEVDGLRHAGLGDFPCTGSFDLSRQIHRAYMGISIETARRTRGALVFLGRNEGQGMLDGSADGVWSGHVATSLGDGRTVEARNHADDVLVSNFDYRYWTYAGLPFWLPVNPFVPPPPEPKEQEVSLIYAPHRQQVQGSTQPAYVRLNIADRQLEGHNGARLKERGGQPPAGKDSFVIKLPGEPIGWTHPVNEHDVVDVNTFIVAIKGKSDTPQHFHFQ